MNRPAPVSIREHIWLYLNTSMHRLETTDAAATTPLPWPPVFIIGAPRSGSTLLYQILVEAFDVGYLSNLHCRFYGGPSFIERWIFPRLARPIPDYTSSHGRIRGRTAPSECGEYWYQFFPREPQAVTAIPEAKQRGLRTAIRKLIIAAKRPFFFKNLMNSLRLLPLAQALPEARFIVIHRDPLANARSLLMARKRIYDDYNRWWSARPANVHELERLPPHQQVVEQIITIHQGIDAARTAIGARSFLDVGYETFCQDVHGGLDQIAHFFATQGAPLTLRPDSIPETFPVSTGGQLEPALENALASYLNSQQNRLPSSQPDA